MNKCGRRDYKSLRIVTRISPAVVVMIK